MQKFKWKPSLLTTRSLINYSFAPPSEKPGTNFPGDFFPPSFDFHSENQKLTLDLFDININMCEVM
jgi:hypothetical protein